MSTIEDVGEQIQALQYKLDQISMYISAQVETEKVHFERECICFLSCSRK